MHSTARKGFHLLASFGLALGAVFGMVGALVSSEILRSFFWAIDGVGLVMAAALLTLKFFRDANDFVAAGFLVFGIGEGIVLSSVATSLSAAIPAFAAGTALWATALLLISIPRGFEPWVRLIGFIAAILFAITAIRIFSGARLGPIASPLPLLGYPVLVLTFIGWIWCLLREQSQQATDRVQENFRGAGD